MNTKTTPPVLYLYRLSRTDGPHPDTLQAAIVVATSAHEARHTYPAGQITTWSGTAWTRKGWGDYGDCGWWAKPPDVEVEKVGIALEGAVVGQVLLQDVWEG